MFAWEFVLVYKILKSCKDMENSVKFQKELLRYRPYMPYKGGNFNPQTLGKCFYFVLCMISRHWFLTKLPNFGDFGAKMSFFRYIINQKLKIFIKHCSPRCSKTPLISEMCIYIIHNLCKWGLGTLGGTMFFRQKIGEGQLLTHEIPL